MGPIETLEELRGLYDAPNPRSVSKVVGHITPLYAQWINASRFVVLATVGPEGCDASPRGDDGAVVRIQDPQTVLLPDWRGNNRLDCLSNIVRDGRISLMFMVPGCENVVRINGQAIVTADAALRARFAKAHHQPRSVIVTTVGEVYFQCANAIMRARIWTGIDESADLPRAGALLEERDASFDGPAYDAHYPDYAHSRMW